MATQQSFLVCDSSTLANFKQWASAISAFFSTAGWTQSTDTGQVNWSTISTVPGSGAYVYEIWKPGDGLTAFYVRIEYGNQASTNQPNIRVSAGTGTNGAGILTGYFTNDLTMHASTVTPPSTTTQYECDFSGDTGRIQVLMWRNGTNNIQGIFSIERSISSTGTYNSNGVTVITGGIPNSATPTNYPCFSQQSFLFASGVGNTCGRTTAGGGSAALAVRGAGFTGVTSTAIGGSINFDTVAPVMGYFDFPLTGVGIAWGADIVEGIPFSLTLYGSTRTYMPTKLGYLGNCFSVTSSSLYALCVRYD